MKKVFIDCGHGGNDSGAIGVNNIFEKNIVLEVGKIVELKLKRCGLDVMLSRNNDSALSLDSRTTKANNWGADCFVSIHCNSFNNQAHGLETYCYKFEYRELADCIHKQILNANLYTTNRGVKEADFYVLKHTSMSASLVELAFIDNVEDVNLLLNKQEEFATAITKGICAYLGVKYLDNTPSTGTMLAVCVGAFKERENAERVLKEAKEKGFKDAYFIPR